MLPHSAGRGGGLCYDMNEALSNVKFNVRKGGRLEPHDVVVFTTSCVHAMASGNEIVEFCHRFLVGELVVNLC